MLTTQELQTQLGVSRNWINTHLRQFGKRRIVNGQTKTTTQVVYDEKDIVEYINCIATFDRQTKNIPYSFFGLISDEEAERLLDNAIDSKNKDEIFDELWKKAMPADFLNRWVNSEGYSRKRVDAWVRFPYHIENLRELQSIQDLLFQVGCPSGSPELAYRHAYLSGLIRVRINGRTYFIVDRNENTSSPKFICPAEMSP